MRCKGHPYEGGVGVCASCLRDRLLALAAAQNEASSLPPAPPMDQPVPLFPRSVSPYVSRRKSDASVPGSWRRHPPPSRLFFRTPQVGPVGSGAGFEEGDIGFQIKPPRRRGKFSALAALFGHRLGSKEEKKVRVREERKHGGSWLAGFMPRGRRKKAPASPPLTSPHRRSPPRAVSDYRGLSPARCSYEGSEESSSVADSPWRPSPSPMRKAPCRRFHGGAGPGVSVCISPLVRPSSGRHHRGPHPPDAPALSGELRPSPHHRLSSLHHCRSWKLADGGRFR